MKNYKHQTHLQIHDTSNLIQKYTLNHFSSHLPSSVDSNITESPFDAWKLLKIS